MAHIEVKRHLARHATGTMTVTFKNSAGSVTDPTTVTFTVRSPAGVETAYVYGTDSQVTKSSTGVFVLTLPLGQIGDWHIFCRGTGTIAQSIRGLFEIDSDPFTSI